MKGCWHRFTSTASATRMSCSKLHWKAHRLHFHWNYFFHLCNAEPDLPIQHLTTVFSLVLIEYRCCRHTYCLYSSWYLWLWCLTELSRLKGPLYQMSHKVSAPRNAQIASKLKSKTSEAMPLSLLILLHSNPHQVLQQVCCMCWELLPECIIKIHISVSQYWDVFIPWELWGRKIS